MLMFIIGLAILVLGYFTYGCLAERILAPLERKTPAIRYNDGVDYVVLPRWRGMLIQLLNIAGAGPVIGAILGIKFGEIALLLIPIGNIIGGSVHDFAGGLISLRYRGINLPSIVRMFLGKTTSRLFTIFMTVLLLLVVTVFVDIPADLMDLIIDTHIPIFWYAIIAIFLYYIVATLFSVDKIIGRIYPFFGMMLLVGTGALFVMLCKAGLTDPSLLEESAAFQKGMNTQPILPVLFVTIACGLISGFHATQSPIIARTMETEKDAKPIFYGMMVVEGTIAMIWAAAAMMIYNLFPEMMSKNPDTVMQKIVTYFLGSGFGTVTIIAVIILTLTSGDTALRCLRLSLAEIIHLPQKKFHSRLILTLPLIVAISGLLAWSSRDAQSFENVWNYFAWGNQVLAVFTLTACTVWLILHRRNFWLTLIPGAFMCFIVLTYILWVSPANTGGKGPWGCGLPLRYAYIVGAGGTLLIMSAVLKKAFARRRRTSTAKV